MTYLAFGLLLPAALSFTAWERRAWGSAKTPFGFVAYPFLAVLFLATFVTPSLGFLALHAGTSLVTALFLSLIAVGSVALRSVAGGPGVTGSRLEASSAPREPNPSERTVSATEYLLLGALLAVLLLPEMLGGSGSVEKGELGAGSLKTHLLHVGMAYLVIALSHRRGQLLARTAFVLLVLWILAFNQVKYLILLPLAAGLLYRWVSGQMSTGKLVAVSFLVPFAVVVAVYAFFSLAALSEGITLTPVMLLELGRHMVSYLVSGIIGLDQLLLQGGTRLLEPQGMEYALAPFVNVFRFAVGSGDYVTFVNPLRLGIETGGVLDSNVFTFFGSLVYRAGWAGAAALTLTYAVLSYWIWSRWRMRTGALACAVGSWWMAPLLFSWFDPYFMHLSIVEVLAILWIRDRLPVGLVKEVLGRRMPAKSAA